jgi:hypothetical protein
LLDGRKVFLSMDQVAHISEPVNHAITELARTNGFAVPSAPKHPRTLPELVERFEEREALENPDVIVHLSKLRLDTEEELLAIPHHGAFRFTDWSRRQMAALVGLRWERWAENANPAEKADELNRRFARATGEVRLRTLRSPDVKTPGDGTLAALVSPGYSPVKDSEMAKRLVTALRPVDDELALIRTDLTDRTSSFVVKVGQPYRVGGEGEVGDVWGGVLFRNSGVGYASILVAMFLHRLLCRNGLTAPLPDAFLLRRQHRSLDDRKLDALLAERFAKLPGRLHVGAALLLESRARRIDDVSIAVRQLLGARRLPVKLLDPILKAYDREPHASAFGLAQAMTLAAQDQSPEVRLDLERAAGEFLAASN